MDKKEAKVQSWKSSLITKSKKDPVWWIEHVLGDTLWDKQKEICNSVRNNERTAVPACVDDNTEILTEERGWQLFKNLKLTDKVASLENEELVFVKPTKFYEYDWDSKETGALIHYQSRHLDFLITPNHKCFVDSELIEASQLYKKSHYKFKTDFKWNGFCEDWTEDYLKFFGYFYAVGEVDDLHSTLTLEQCSRNRSLKNLLELFKSFKNYETYEINYGSKFVTFYVIRNVELIDWLAKNFGKKQKFRRIPQWLKKAPSEKLKAFIDGFVLAKGKLDKRKGRGNSVKITDKNIADSLQEIAIKAGYHTQITELNKNYTLTFSLNFGKTPISVKDNWSKKHYVGKVYCVEVPSHIILIRRNGKCHWTGNSFGVGKCLEENENVPLANGKLVQAKNLVDKRFLLNCFDQKTGKIVKSLAYGSDNGIKDVYKLTLRSGRTFLRTEHHPFFTKSEVFDTEIIQFVELCNLKVKLDSVLCPCVDRVQHKSFSKLELFLSSFFKNDKFKNAPLGFYWDKVLSVEYYGKEKTVALTVPEYQTFITNAVEHNTFIASRIALWFLYNHYPSRVVSTAPCFDDKTEILTENDGWKLFKDLDKTEKVASLVDGKMLFVYPEDYMDYEVEGELIGYKSQSLDFLITPHHNCYVKKNNEWFLEKAENIYQKYGYYFNKEVNWEGIEDEKTEKDYEELGKNSHISKNLNFENLKNKPPYKIKAFLKGFLRNKKYFKVRSDKKLADLLQELGLKAGYIVNLKTYEFEYFAKKIQTYTTQKVYALYFLENLNKKHTQAKQKSWYKENYSGHVYCVKVPSGIIFVRRNGMAHWSGNTMRQVKDLLWTEIRSAHAKSKVPLGGEPLTLSLKLDDEQFAVGFSTDDSNIDMFTGYHSPNQLVIFDQAGGLSKLFYEGAEGLMTSMNCRWLAISNTAISDCEFANICMPDRRSKHGIWNIIPINAFDSPNVKAGKNIFPGLISTDWIEARTKAWGKDDPLYKIFVQAEFVPSVQMNVIPYMYLNKGYETPGEDNEPDIQIGLDIARTGLDSTVWFARCGQKALEIRRVTGNDTMSVAGLTIEFKRQLEEKYEKPVSVIKLDIIGIGAGVYDRLSELGFPVLAINNAEVKSVVDPERYLNVRAEMAWALRHRFEKNNVGLSAVFVQEDDIIELLKGDLQVMKYKITSGGKIQILSKEEIKKDLGRSPDYWDAMVMAYEHPGGGPAVAEFVSGAIQKLSKNQDLTKEEWLRLLGYNVDINDPSFH